ncbi:hypothetical protein Ndes2526B_g06137 [Nannochloris sp. 'desiccata']|nr:hypothetical protein KSW81_007931 [Chlorella desiccata (nom. nud.)]KAH7619186.1 hypothetical protein NADE_006031 [Chlorella desiccata (nom. nud.)]
MYTVGHATRTVSELVSLLHEHNIRTLIDIRTIPCSRTNPQHNIDNLRKLLPVEGIVYHWLGKALGGRRHCDKSLGDLNSGWYNASFRGYADYMQSNEFAAGLQDLFQLAKDSGGPCALMCAETYFRRCHRNLVSDALTALGYRVMHIISPGKPAVEHQMTQFANVEKLPMADKKNEDKGAPVVIRITYPAYEEAKNGLMKTHKKDKKQPRIDSVLKKKEM